MHWQAQNELLPVLQPVFHDLDPFLVVCLASFGHVDYSIRHLAGTSFFSHNRCSSYNKQVVISLSITREHITV